MNQSTNISLIRWHNPADTSPEEASYILIRQEFGDGEFYCSEAAYEKGQYWQLLSSEFMPVSITTIAGWAYLPFDNRQEANHLTEIEIEIDGDLLEQLTSLAHRIDCSVEQFIERQR